MLFPITVPEPVPELVEGLPRNSHIFFSLLRQWGCLTGIPTIQDELRKNGSPLAQIETDEGRTYFLLEIPCREGFENASGETHGETLDDIKLTERQLLIYNKIKEDTSLSAKSLSRLIGFSQRTVEREISFLRNNGFIDKTTKENKSNWMILRDIQIAKG